MGPTDKEKNLFSSHGIGENNLIIVQTPLRISLFGGGTDFPSFFMEEGGCVLSSAIDKYIFVTIKERFDNKLRIGYTQTEMVDEIDQINHGLFVLIFSRSYNSDSK